MVKLKGKLRDDFYHVDGIYVRENTKINGQFAWIQDNLKNAIWSSNGKWNIGYKAELGGARSIFCSTTSAPGPKHPKIVWTYFLDEEWVQTKDILVQCKYLPNKYAQCT